MQEAEGDSERSADKFPEYFAIWEDLKLDPSLLKETEEVNKNDLIVDEDPRSFVALVKNFLTNNTMNLLNDESEFEMFAVDVDPAKQEVYVTMNYSVTLTLEDRQNLSAKIILKLLRTKDEKLQVKLLRDEESSSIQCFKIIELLRNEFDYLVR